MSISDACCVSSQVWIAFEQRGERAPVLAVRLVDGAELDPELEVVALLEHLVGRVRVDALGELVGRRGVGSLHGDPRHAE